MILGPVSLVDCAVFCTFLAPQLLLQAGLFRTITVIIRALPFLLLQLPIQFLYQRYCTSLASQPVFVQGSTAFEDFVVRCVRYAFKNIDTGVARVFFSKQVALPFARWRMLRHGYLRFPVHWHECEVGVGSAKCRGIWITHKSEQQPDFVLYYAHGGGFALGSPFFYLEFLLAWHHLLLEAGFKNPAIFGSDYTLVPEGVYPRQMLETLHGYKHAVEVAGDASKVCVAGDSAGATLILSLLLELGAQADIQNQKARRSDAKEEAKLLPQSLPQMAVLISPWVTLKSDMHNPSSIDYLDRQTLWKYADEYAGRSMIQHSPASPGSCSDEELWRSASPKRGLFITYGEDEVLGPDIENFLQCQKQAGIEVRGLKYAGGVHAWPVASLFLASTGEARLKGLRSIVEEISKRFDITQSAGRKKKK